MGTKSEHGVTRDAIPSKPLQESDGYTGNVGEIAVVEKAYALGERSFSPVLNLLNTRSDRGPTLIQ